MTRMQLVRTLAAWRPDLADYRNVVSAYRITLKFDHAVSTFWRDSAPASEGCVCSVLGIEIVVFAAFATVVLVRCRDLENFDAGLLHGMSLRRRD
jgi:hypothetical protein